MSHEKRDDEVTALSRRAFVTAGTVGAALAVTSSRAQAADAGMSPAPKPFALEELSIDELQAGMGSGKYTARGLVEQYLARIDELDQRGPALNQVLEKNPDALVIADQLDAERKAGKLRGPLHGIPILLKDNIDTADRMHTSAGSLALAEHIAPRDAFVAERLRAAGAVLLGKTNMSEWANIRSTHSSSGWSGRGGQGKNPYALDRNTSGSSSGSAAAAAASYCAAAIGTETDGSVTSPAAACSLVGIKPTVGLVSRSGIIPISHSQDTAGPMTRTVRDAALVLGALVGNDPRDRATAQSSGKARSDYASLLDPNGLKGARIGVVRERFMGYSRKTDKLVEEALDVMKRLGATLVDPANLATAAKFDESELDVLLYELKDDLNKYLAGAGPGAAIRSLADAIAFNEKNAARELPYFGQELFIQAQAKGPLTDKKYRDALAKGQRLAGREGIDATLRKHKLDALVAPTQGPVWLIDLVNGDSGGGSFTSPAAVAGYPHITVPLGFVHGLPVGLSFAGTAWSEASLLRFAYAFEQATQARRSPAFSRSAAL